MSKIKLFLLSILCILLFNCDKDNDQLETDKQIIRDYLVANNIDAKEFSSGLFYIIDKQGTGAKPTTSSYVTVKYKGYLTNGTVFDQTGNEPRTFLLANTIDGWKTGIPLFNKGAKGRLFIPSDLGYGENGSGSIPGNSVLIFDIELVSFR